MFSLYLARCCHAPASTLNCSIWSSSSIFLLLMFSTSVSSAELWGCVDGCNEIVQQVRLRSSQV
jgi:hypothetical protein